MVEGYVEIEAEDDADFKKQVSTISDKLESVLDGPDYEIVDDNEAVENMVRHNHDEAKNLELRYSLEDTIGDKDEYLINEEK
jgi:hypothetical protein